MEQAIIQKCMHILLKSFPNLLAMYVFGSFGTKYETVGSDIDIAVLFPQAVDRVQLWRVSQDLAAEIGRDVDLVDLQRASTVFRFQILTTSNRVYCSDVKQCDAIENNYLSMYLRLNEERAQILQDKQNGK